MTGADDLALTQWLSPAFPLGSFAYAHGLEQAVAEAAVTDAASLAAWLDTVLRDGAGLSDAALIGAAMAGRDAGELDTLARALAPSRQRAAETVEQGAAFARTLAAMGRAVPAAALPVALGVAARGLDLPPAHVAARYLHGFVANLVAAAQRLMPLGQSRAQALLAGLSDTILDTAARGVTLPPETVTTCVFAADLAAMRHETLQPRLFRS
jgi:urease accessory protein